MNDGAPDVVRLQVDLEGRGEVPASQALGAVLLDRRAALGGRRRCVSGDPRIAVAITSGM